MKSLKWERFGTKNLFPHISIITAITSQYKLANLAVTLWIDIYNVMSTMVVPTVNKNGMEDIFSRIRRVGFLEELVQLEFLRELKPVVDLYVVVGQRVVLKAHQLQVQNRWKRQELDALLGFLQTQTTNKHISQQRNASTSPPVYLQLLLLLPHHLSWSVPEVPRVQDRWLLRAVEEMVDIMRGSTGKGKLTTVANKPDFPGCRPMNMERSPDNVTSAKSLSTFRQRIKTHRLSNPFSQYSLDWTSPNLSSGPSSSWYYLGHFKNPGLID